MIYIPPPKNKKKKKKKKKSFFLHASLALVKKKKKKTCAHPGAFWSSTCINPYRISGAQRYPIYKENKN